MTNPRHRSIATIRLDAFIRLLNLRSICRFNDSILVTEYPKSGGTWLGEMVADMYSLKFPQNRFPHIQGCLYHGHYLQQFHSVKTIVLWRDPRDIVVSWYYHTLTSSVSHTSMQKHAHEALQLEDVTDIKNNLPSFIDYMFTGQRTPKFTWCDFFDSWFNNSDVFHTSYEQLSADSAGELVKLCHFFDSNPNRSMIDSIVAARSFEAVSGRKRGQNDPSSFLRKGVPGDWINCFSDEASGMLQSKIGNRLNQYCEKFIETGKANHNQPA